MSALPLHIALRCEHCLACCFAVKIREGRLVLLFRGFDVSVERYLDVAIGKGDGALSDGTEALKVAAFTILVASWLAL